MKCVIHVGDRFIPAIFGWPAIHVRDNKFTPNSSNIFLDCGCNSYDEVINLGIQVGSIVTFDSNLMYLNKNFLVGRGLDNKMGGFIISEVLKKIYSYKDNIPFSLYFVNSVQEEVGLRGASIISNNIKPDLAIVVDVTHDTNSPFYNKVKYGDIKCGKGPVLNYAPSIQNNLLNLMIDVANNNNINFQRLSSSNSTNTDTDAFSYSNNGVPSILISLPLKYMHTTVEMSHKNDVEDIIFLIYKFLFNLESNFNFNYFN
jgi:putative aminopeptidase FrvX